MGIDRIEHRITLGEGGPKSENMKEMIDLIIKHQVYYDANLQMYGGINLRKELGPMKLSISPLIHKNYLRREARLPLNLVLLNSRSVCLS